MRGVDDDGAGLGCDGLSNFGHVRPKGARREGHAYHHATGKLNVGDVAVVAGLQHHHLITRVHHSQYGRQDGLRGPSGDGDVLRWVVAVAVQGLNFVGHPLTQRGNARHGRVLVQALGHGLAYGLQEFGVAFKVRKTLA